jgi:preprotein translocase subunit SecA
VVAKAIENAQTKVEGHNFDIRKHLIKYDDVINQQREVIYTERRRILSNPDLSDVIWGMVETYIHDLVQTFTTGNDPEEWDLSALMSEVRVILPLPATLTSSKWEGLSAKDIEDQVLNLAEEKYNGMEVEFSEEGMRRIEKSIMLGATDMLWVRHLTALDSLRQGIGLRAYGHQDPLVSYQREGFEMYNQLRSAIQEQVVRRIFHVQAVREAPKPRNIQTIHRTPPEAKEAKAETPGATPQPQEPIRVEKTLGRNELCHCGSGKKYKACHMKLDLLSGNGAPIVVKKGPNMNKSAKAKVKK